MVTYTSVLRIRHHFTLIIHIQSILLARTAVKDVRIDDSDVLYVLTTEELIKINSNAEIIFRRSVDNFCSVGILEDNNYLLAGNSGIFKYDGSDNEIWSFHYTTDDGLYTCSMALNGLSEFVLCGASSVSQSNSQGVIY